MKIFLCSILFLAPLLLIAQNKNFRNSDDKITVYDGDLVEIKSDTAFIISKSRAKFLNEKLDELVEIQTLYNSIVDNRSELLNQLKDVQKQVGRLSKQMQRDSTFLTNEMALILSDLDQTLQDLRSNNQSLQQNNKALKSKVNQLERIVKDLRKATRHIWWNGLTDKLVAFGVGALVGILIVSL